MSDSEIIIGLASIVVFGVGAQWIGRRLGIPSLLLLLPAGLLAGPVLGLVDPEQLFGDTLFPGITLLVSLLLFQAALGLRLRELPRPARGPVLRLATIGAAITFVGAATAAGIVLGLPKNLAFLTGAILVVSGPTVVGPLLRAVRPADPADSVLTWESTALDPIGATLGVVVLNLVVATGGGVHPVLQMLGRLGVGVGVGAAAAVLLVAVMSRFLVSDEMEAAVALLFAVVAFAVAEVLLSEAGLFATTTLGFIAANQDIVPTARIKGFGETLEVLIIGSLFVVLGALITLNDLSDYAWRTAVLAAVLVVVVRPLSVGLSLVGTRLGMREQAFIACVDPRGIVAAATAAQFTGTLTNSNIEHSFLLPVVFGVIVGNESWALDLARHLRRLGISVLVVTAAPGEDPATAGLPTISIFDDEEAVARAIDSATIAKALVSAPPYPAVSLLTADLVEDLGRRQVLDVRGESTGGHRRIEHATARAFEPGATRERIEALVAAGATVEARDSAPDGGLLFATVSAEGDVDLQPRAQPVVDGTTFIGLFVPSAS